MVSCHLCTGRKCKGPRNVHLFEKHPKWVWRSGRGIEQSDCRNGVLLWMEGPFSVVCFWDLIGTASRACRWARAIAGVFRRREFVDMTRTKIWSQNRKTRVGLYNEGWRLSCFVVWSLVIWVWTATTFVAKFPKNATSPWLLLCGVI